ncbi:MAG TPA: GAF domain-containing protein [Holophaga sp.]|nr:GAF domain-containing protein [Holophaga sp.]HPS68695.1 GAF domain-containing protein [Holophaga sp.]
MPRIHKNDRHNHPTAGGSQGDHLTALGDFVERAFPDPAQLFDHGLNLLVQQLHVDRAVMIRVTKLGYEPFWWALAEGVPPDQAVHEAACYFCPKVLQNPARSLVIKDALSDRSLLGHPAFRKLGVRAYIGVPLRQSNKTIGVLSVQSARPMAFTREEIAVVNAMANVFSKTLEIENLKHELYMTREALDLTSAVVEDSALETAGTRLPNRHYLEIWLKANLYLARRRAEPMSIAMWTLPAQPGTQKALREVADALRGEDLLVDLGREEFQLLLPRTGILGAEILLERIRAKLGPIPMGATLWHPLHKTDRDDLALHQATQRAAAALQRSQKRGVDGLGDLVWELLDMRAEDMVDNTTPW